MHWQDFVTATGTTATRQDSEPRLNDMLKELRIEIAQRGGRVGGLREEGCRNPHAVREATVVSSLLDESSGEVQLDLNRHQLGDSGRAPVYRQDVYVLIIRASSIVVHVEHTAAHRPAYGRIRHDVL